MKLLPFLLILAGLAAGAQNTNRGKLRPLPEPSAREVAEPAVAYDTIASPKAHLVDLNGYDKPLRSRRETFFATNNGPVPVAGLALTLTYFDSSNRMLHKVPARVNVDIPSGETRQVSLKSWDTQQAFYYVRSAVPARTSQATPFDVTISVDTIFCPK